MKQASMILLISLISGFGLQAAEFAENSDKQVVGYTPRLKKDAEIRASFVKLRGLLDSLDSETQLHLYRGVPRTKVIEFEKSGGSQNPKNKEYMSRYASVFYSKGQLASKKDADKLLALVKSSQSFEEFSGFKLCGWFHPNYALVWTKGKTVIEMHVCLTCHEIKLFQSRVEVYCNIDNDAYQQFLDFGKSLNPKSEK